LRRHHPWFVKLPSTAQNGLSKLSGADAFQVKSLSESRFIKKIGTLPTSKMDEIAAAVVVCIDY
jgi:mRNA interferase MazF